MRIHTLRLAACAALFGLTGSAQAIVGGTATSAFGQVNHGVQITDNWVLTARHVGYSVGGVYANGYGSSTIAARYDLGGGAFPANDLALLRLSSAIDSPDLALWGTAFGAGAFGTPLDATIVTGSNQVPRGYGHTGVQEALSQIDPDGSGPLASVPLSWLVAYTYDPVAGFTTPYVESGDSGGGLFLGHVTDSASPLLGITSAALNGDVTIDINGTPTTLPFHGSAFVQLASYRNWINDTMAADAADLQVANWITAVPEPATSALWALGLGVTGLLRRRARTTETAQTAKAAHASRVA